MIPRLFEMNRIIGGAIMTPQIVRRRGIGALTSGAAAWRATCPPTARGRARGGESPSCDPQARVGEMWTKGQRLYDGPKYVPAAN